MRHLVLLTLAVFAALDAGSSRAEEEHAAIATAADKHRLDLTYLAIETFDTFVDTDVLLISYTMSLSERMRAGLTVGGIFVTDHPDPGDTDTQKSTERGPSDTLLSFQYDFSENITVSPWIPRSLGLNTQLLIPTGDADKGLSLDAWLLDVGLGWPIDLFLGISMVPGIGYNWTFAEGEQTVPASQAYLTFPFVWVSHSGFWIEYSYWVSRELDADDWLDDHALTAGKMFRNGFAISLNVGSVERVGPVYAPDDEQVVFNLHYQFGQ